MSLIDKLLDLVQTREFWARVVALVIFVAASLGLDLANKVDADQITTLVMAIVGALVIFDPWRLVMVILEFLGILQGE